MLPEELMDRAEVRKALGDKRKVLPDDVKTLIKPVLAHRLILNENERLRGEKSEHILTQIIKQTPIPDGTT